MLDELYGITTDRERKLEWMASLPCLECTRAADLAAAKAANAELVTLEGSVKQVAWAETIRASRMAEVSHFRVQVEAAPDSPKKSRALESLDKIEGLTSSKTLIDTRELTFRSFAVEILK